MPSQNAKKVIELGATPTETAKVNLPAMMLLPSHSWRMNTLDVTLENATARECKMMESIRKDTTRKLVERSKTMTGRIH